jgi:Flp pilus assembly protein TadD
MRGARFCLALLGAGTLLGAQPGPAAAQLPTPSIERPDAALSRNLRLLAQNPNSVTALMGAGRAALELGDPEAAITFFARAEKQTPADGRIKMWIGAAMVHLQQPRAALRFFQEAADLGVPEADVAAERGLAYDISGDPRSAQRDYRLVLQRGRDPEATRRLALSLAISGQREPALRLLEEQLLVGDRAAERARAMILALTGDVAGADRAVRASMPDAQANAMSPFLSRLRGLSTADRALAVHLGVFPGAGSGSSGTAYAATDFASAVSSATQAGRPDESRASLARRVPDPQPVSIEPRRRPGTEVAAASPAQAPPRVPARTSAPVTEPAKPTVRTADARPQARKGTVSSRSDWYWARGGMSTTTRAEKPKPKPVEPKPLQPEPDRLAVVMPPPATEGSGEAAGITTVVDDQTPLGPATAPIEIAVSTVAGPAPAGVIAAPADAIVSGIPSAPIEPAPEPTPTASRLAELAASLATVDEQPLAAASLAARKPAPRAAATKASAPVKKPAAPAEPSRVWVQVAGGADKSALPREFARLKAKAPKALAARSAWTTPLNATNRLLVGPFPNAQAAQAFVNQLKAETLTAFAWTSAAGQKIEKLPAK